MTDEPLPVVAKSAYDQLNANYLIVLANLRLTHMALQIMAEKHHDEPPPPLPPPDYEQANEPYATAMTLYKLAEVMGNPTLEWKTTEMGMGDALVMEAIRRLTQ